MQNYSLNMLSQQMVDSNGNLVVQNLSEQSMVASLDKNLAFRNYFPYNDFMLELKNGNVETYKRLKNTDLPAIRLVRHAILAVQNEDAKALIDSIENINEQLPDLGNETVLHLAAGCKNFEIIDYLLQRQDIDVDIVDDKCLTPWMHGIVWGWRKDFMKRYGYNFEKFTTPVWKRMANRFSFG